MKRKIILLLVFLIVMMCGVLSFVHKNIYDSPESFCEKCGYETYYIISGDNSAFIVFQESKSKMGNAFLKKTDQGYESVGYHVEQKDFFDPYSGKIYKSRAGMDRYLMVLLSEEKGQTITDCLESSFIYIPFMVLPGEETPQSTLAVAYIGCYSDDYYKNEYWYEIK